MKQGKWAREHQQHVLSPWEMTGVCLSLLVSIIMTQLAMCPFLTCISAADLLSTKIIFFILSMSMSQWILTFRHFDKAVASKKRLGSWLVGCYFSGCSQAWRVLHAPTASELHIGSSALDDSINKHSRCDILPLYCKQIHLFKHADMALECNSTGCFWNNLSP